MNLLDNDHLQQLVDYSFGDHSGVLGGVPQAFMKKANLSNWEFDELCVRFEGKVMTLFIDNIRLYQRPINHSDWLHMKPISSQDREWLNQFSDEGLLELCASFPKNQFVIFTAFEDTPLDDHIWAKIPPNVQAIHSANGVVFGGRVYPFPHGIERKMHEGYNHHEILLKKMNEAPPLRWWADPEIRKILFVAHRADTGNRSKLGELFADKPWATVTHLPYEQYLDKMKLHQFVLCPSGNGIGSSRNWETLYMRRVPVMEDHPYKRELFKDFPVLFVKDYSEVTEELLLTNGHLYVEAQKMDMSKLDLVEIFNKRKNGN
jgi:hypothetical protein